MTKQNTYKKEGRIDTTRIKHFENNVLNGCTHGSRPTPSCNNANAHLYWAPLMGDRLTAAEAKFVSANINLGR